MDFKKGNVLLGIDKTKYPYTFKGVLYAFDIVLGEIPACQEVLGACKRFIKDMERIPIDSECPFYFDPERSEKYLRLTQKFKHVIGRWKDPYINYAPWQCFIWLNIMGFVSHATGERRFRTAYVAVPRGSGKSTMASQCGLYFMALDNPNGNSIGCFATKKDQSRIVLDAARAMARGNQKFLTECKVKVLAHKIEQVHTNSSMVALSSDHNGLDGRADILAICDELHAMKKKTFETVESGMSKRTDSLLLCITTAGYDVDGVGYSQHSYACKVATGIVDDDTYFSICYTIDQFDDPLAETSWIKANPNLGVSVDAINFAAKAKKAKESPSDFANFKIKHLNIWVSEAQAFFNINKWDLCADKSLKFEDFYGKKCFIGIDLASKVDLSAFVFVFFQDDKYYVFAKAYIPEVTVKESRNAIYETCVGTGHLIATPGEAIHYPKLEAEFVEIAKKLRVDEALYDPWNATEFAQRVTKERINMTEFRMTTANLSEPTKMLDALIRERRVVHDGNPLLRYCIANVVAKPDNNENVFPKKSNEKLKIDLAIGLIMGIAGWISQEDTSSVYESRGLRIL